MTDADAKDLPEPQSVVVGLVRCSTDRQEHSIEDQEAEIRAWSDKKGYRVLEVFQDEGVSGSVLDRPGVVKLLAFLKASPERGTLVAWKRNRLARPSDPIDGMLLERHIRELGWKIHYLHGDAPSGDPELDGLLAYIQHWRNGQFLRDLSVDTIRGQLRRVLAGEVPGGLIPYGYAKVIVGPDGTERRLSRHQRHRKLKEERGRWVLGDQAEIDVVRRIYARYTSDEAGCRQIAAELNGDSIPSPNGRQWTSGTVREILTNRVFAGDLVWNKESSSSFFCVSDKKPERKAALRQNPNTGKKTGYASNKAEDWIVLQDHHPPLVDRSLFALAQQVREKRYSRPAGDRRVSLLYPLRSLVRCAQCGSPMHGFSSQAKGLEYRKYSCASYRTNKTCASYSIEADPLESAVLRKLRDAYLPTAQVPGGLRDRILNVLRRRLGQNGPAATELTALKTRRASLDAQVNRALDNLAHVEGEAAHRLGQLINRWTLDRGEIDKQLAVADERKALEVDLEKTADEVVQMLTELSEMPANATLARRRNLFQSTVRSVELKFQTRPLREGRKRVRHDFVGGWVDANPLLGIAQQALAQAVPTGGASVQPNGLPEGQAVVTSESSSGRTRTYNQVVNSHP